MSKENNDIMVKPKTSKWQVRVYIFTLLPKFVMIERIISQLWWMLRRLENIDKL